MASGLKSLIKLHKHELDEKRRQLALFYDEQAALRQQQSFIEIAFEKEKEAIAKSQEISYTFVNYAEEIKRKLKENAERQAEMQLVIDIATDDMMLTFSELKKYEMTQAARDQREEDERTSKENKELDEIAIEGFRRKQEEDK